MELVIGRIHMALRAYSVLDIYCLPLPSLCKTTHRHWIHMNVHRVSCGCVFNMLLVLSISNLFSLQYMGLYVFNWPISVLGDWKDISIAHVIIIIKSEVTTFPIVIISTVVVCPRCLFHHILSRENREFVFNIIVQFIIGANIRIRFGLEIVLVCCTAHHLIIIIVQIYLKALNLWNACQIHFDECVSKIKHMLSVIHSTIFGAVCFSLSLSVVMIDIICILCT